MHYIINVGDAWFAQVPREGNIFVRADNIHDTATRCTACHPSSFSTEANLVAHRNGYPIRSKSNFQYVIDRIAQLDHAALWRRRPVLAAIHRDPAPGPGKAGGILLDFEREVAGRETETVERFGPFLQGRVGGRVASCPPTSRTASSRSTASSASPGATGESSASWPRRTGRDDFARARPTTSPPSSASGPPTGGSKRFRIGFTASTPGG